MATLEKLRDNSKPIIWFVIIAFVVGFAGVGLFSYISDNKLNIFGMSSPNRYSMAINGEAIEHTDSGGRGNENGLDYIRTFYGFKSASGLGNTTSTALYDAPRFEYHDIDIYGRHIQTEDELKGRVLTDNLYKELFNNNLSDLDILMFLKTELETRQASNITGLSPITRVANTFLNETYFIGFEEPFTDLPDGQWDPSEQFTDLNNNRWRDPGEDFTDSKGNGIRDNDTYTDMNDNGIWDEGDILGVDRNQNGIWESEDFEDLTNGIWDEGEEFTDSNDNGVWDEGEEFDDTGDGVWDNGLDKWLDHCISKGEIAYSLIYDKNIAQRLENYISAVVSYHIKNKKYELAFNSLNYEPEIYKKQDYLLKNSNAVISYISYDLNNLSEEDLNNEINEEELKSEITAFETVEMGYFSNISLILILILFIIFSIKNRSNRALVSLGTVFSVLLGLIVIFKLKSDSSQGTHKYKNISYLYLKIDSESEDFTDKGNGVWDEGEEFEDLNNNGIWDYEGLEYAYDDNGNEIAIIGDHEPLTDKGNNTWDIGEDYNDSNGNGIWDSKEALTKLKFENLIEQIEISDFKTVYDNFEGKKDENIILSEELTQNNLNNLKINLNESSFEIVDGDIVQRITNQEAQIFGSIIFELLKTVFKTDENNTFVINHNNPKDGALEGYIIGYINEQGNHFEKVEYDKLKENYLESAKEKVFLAKASSLLEPELLIQNVESIQESNQDSLMIASITQEYNDFGINFGYGDETLIADALIRGYISQMQEAEETSEIIIGDDTAYIIHIVEPSTEKGLFIPDNYNYIKSYDTFASFFNNMKRTTKILDWRNEAYYMIDVNNPNQDAGSIDNIYLNLSNFEAVIKTALGIVDFNVK